MKNVDLKKVKHLVSLQMNEQKKYILTATFGLTITLTLLSWVMYSESISDGVEASFKTLVGLACLFPVLTYFSDFIKGKGMMFNVLFPASSLEKYTSIWAAGILTTLYYIVSVSILMSILWISICTIGYEMSLEEIFHATSYSELLFSASVSWSLTSGFAICIIGKHQKGRLKYTIPISAICLIIVWTVLVGFLPSVLGEEGKMISLILMFVLESILGIGFMTWGYFLFKKIQFINK